MPQPSPPPLRHTRAHTHRHGGISRPRAPPRGLGAVNSPVGLVTGHPGTAAQSGPAGKAARTVGRRPGEALTQPNPTQPPPHPTVLYLPRPPHLCRRQPNTRGTNRFNLVSIPRLKLTHGMRALPSGHHRFSVPALIHHFDALVFLFCLSPCMAPQGPSTPTQDPVSAPWDTEQDILLLCCCTSALPSLPLGDHIQPGQPEPVPHAPSQCFCLPCLYFCTNHWQVGPHTALSRPHCCRVSGMPHPPPPRCMSTPCPISLPPSPSPSSYSGTHSTGHCPNAWYPHWLPWPQGPKHGAITRIMPPCLFTLFSACTSTAWPPIH